MGELPKPDVDDVLRAQACRAQEVADAEGAALGLLDGSSVDWKVGVGLLAEGACRGGPDEYCAAVARSQEADIVDDAQRLGWASAHECGFRSILTVPLPFAGETIGLMTVVHRDAGRFSDTNARRLALVSNLYGLNLLAANAFVEQRRLLDALSESQARLRTAEERFRIAFDNAPIGMALGDLEEQRYISVNRAFCRLVGRDEAEVRATDWRAITHPDDIAREEQELQRIVAGDRSPFTIEKRYLRPDGSVVWALFSATAASDDEGHPSLLIAQVVDLSGRKEAENRLAHQALHDHLTGLPNRALFIDRTNRALELSRVHGTGVAMLFLDLDRFKVINDSLGHDAGDQLLRATADRLAETIRPTDTLARFAGDEFAVLCEDVASVEDAVGVASRLIACLEQPVALGTAEVVISASVGVALPRDDQATADLLLRDADTAMYLAKDMGRGRVEVFDEKLRKRAVRRLETESGLRRAMERSELRLAYQPEIDLVTGHLAGIEALVRWEHPERGLLPPSEFIAVAEETGLVNVVGAWVLREAAAQLARWRAAYPHMVEVGMAVNVSARQLADPGIIAEVEAAVAAAGGGAPLCLEITETALLESASPAGDTLRRLKTRGVLLGIDDFGTSYSSLSNVTRLAPDFLKVDRSFVDGLGVDPHDSAIVAAVINLAHTLGLFVIAEGVESQAQVQRLRSLGCDLVQGFVVSKPLPPEEFELMMVVPVDAIHLGDLAAAPVRLR
jgi:diguanylate cyclase (GGDEF)-like protein/PAS domain S-box-containing protein